MKAIWHNQILAESDETIVVEKNYYFPMSSVNMDYFIPSDTKSFCPWKGDASYYSVIVNGEKNIDAAWYYPTPKDAAKEIINHLAFWKEVEVRE